MMKKIPIIAASLLLPLSSCSGQVNSDKTLDKEVEHEYTNQLISESSPYLLQHAHNPVNWHPWNDATLKKAQKEDKMLIISIGYSACHWCHVMEHESFEDTEVANLMNKHFISIKVDREERPDIDQVYMNAAQLMTGRGGWPLNALALPDGKPFYAGTYFGKSDWMAVLNHFVELKKSNPNYIIQQAENVTQEIHATENIVLVNAKSTFSMEDLDKSFDRLKPSIDFKKGGGHGAPKFPMPSIWEYVLHYSQLSGNQEALRAVTSTLDNMAHGGIYDHVGGGFARYSTDDNWHVPHFEKMLYDNSQLVSLYAHAWQKTKKPLYKQAVYETLEFIEREMTSPEGGFYSALDADSEGEEGKFYVWTKEAIDDALGEEANIYADYYNVTKTGNWEHGKNILFRNQTNEKFAKKHNLSVKELEGKIKSANSTLLKIRSERIRPGLDDKILTSWNALMIKGYTHAYRSFGEEKFLKSAIRNADFLLENSIGKDGAITRNYKDGKSSIPGFLDDYAFVISAFIELYQATFDEKWLDKANQLAAYTLVHFFDDESGMFYYTHDNHSNLISRKMEVSDNVIPASNSEMAKNLLFLGNYYYREDYIQKSEQMLTNVLDNTHQNIYFYSNWGILEAHFVQPPYTVAIVGKDYKSSRQELDQNYIPHVLLLGGNSEGNLNLLEDKLIKGQTTIYVCQDKVCKRPVTGVAEAITQL